MTRPQNHLRSRFFSAGRTDCSRPKNTRGRWGRDGRFTCVQPVGLGTFVLTSQSVASCNTVDPRRIGVETEEEPQAPTSEPSAPFAPAVAG